MRKLPLLIFILSLLFGSASSQTKGKPKKKAKSPVVRLPHFTLTGTYAEDGHGTLKRSDKADSNCFDFAAEAEGSCDKRWDLVYGNLRVAEEWDWFTVPASGDNRSRLISLGKKEWSEVRSLPEVEALPKLRPGEKRVVGINASGSSGAAGAAGCPGTPGSDGRNGNGTDAPAIKRQDDCSQDNSKPQANTVKPTITGDLFVRAVKGEMYLLRVVDDEFEYDFYVVFRVDNIVRGRTATISWKKLEVL